MRPQAVPRLNRIAEEGLHLVGSGGDVGRLADKVVCSQLKDRLAKVPNGGRHAVVPRGEQDWFPEVGVVVQLVSDERVAFEWEIVELTRRRELRRSK